MLGLGVVAIMAGLRGAGEIIDRQTGWGLAGVLDPSGSGGGPGTTLVTWTAVAALVRDGSDQRAPVAGRQPAGDVRAIPPGRFDAAGGVSLAPGAGDLVVRLVHQSLVLTVQVAAPVSGGDAVGVGGDRDGGPGAARDERAGGGDAGAGAGRRDVAGGGGDGDAGRVMTDAVPGVLHEVRTRWSR